MQPIQFYISSWDIPGRGFIVLCIIYIFYQSYRQ